MRAADLHACASSIEAATTAGLVELRRLPESQRRRALLLLALEREQVVDVVYSEAHVERLIADLDAPADVVDVVRRAVLWIHRDEALHAQYVRGMLLRGRRRNRYDALAVGSILAAQAVGAIGGWCSAVSRRGNDDHLGLRSLAGRLALAAGTAVGRVPRGLADAVAAPGFEAFCRVNLSLERAAIMAYEELLPLLDGDRATFERILADERRHAQVFELFDSAFDGDRLRAGSTAGELSERLSQISPWFVARGARGEASSVGIGSGATVGVVDASDDERALRDAVDLVLEPVLRDLVASGARVAIRPSFMLGYDRRDRSNIVSPEMLSAVAATCRSLGAVDVAVIESPTVYDRFFGGRSVDQVAHYFGFDDPGYRVVDAGAEQRPVEFDRGVAEASAPTTWLDADVRIVVARPAGDPAEVAHGALSTLPGLCGRIDEQVYTDRLVDHRTAALMLLDVAPPDAAILDLWGDVADGPLGVMGCRTPSSHRRVYAGRDAIAVDAALLGDLGASPASSEFIRRADQWFGTTSVDLPAGSSAGALDGYRVPQRSLWFRLISATAVPIYANFSGNGRWFVPAMDTTAFPPIDGCGVIVRTVRRAAQLLFGLEPPRSNVKVADA